MFARESLGLRRSSVLGLGMLVDCGLGSEYCATLRAFELASSSSSRFAHHHATRGDERPENGQSDSPERDGMVSPSPEKVREGRDDIDCNSDR